MRLRTPGASSRGVSAARGWRTAEGLSLRSLRTAPTRPLSRGCCPPSLDRLLALLLVRRQLRILAHVGPAPARVAGRPVLRRRNLFYEVEPVLYLEPVIDLRPRAVDIEVDLALPVRRSAR